MTFFSEEENQTCKYMLYKSVSLLYKSKFLYVILARCYFLQKSYTFLFDHRPTLVHWGQWKIHKKQERHMAQGC